MCVGVVGYMGDYILCMWLWCHLLEKGHVLFGAVVVVWSDAQWLSLCVHVSQAKLSGLGQTVAVSGCHMLQVRVLRLA